MTRLRTLSLLLLLGSSLAMAAEKPNILLILADDMGYGDLGVTGSQVIQTPHIDRIAQEGILCTQGYVPSSVCSPSRAGILTGRDPRRFGYQANLNNGPENYAGQADLLGLPVGEHTLADHLKPAGYDTALIGKWHQGLAPQFHPNKRGFDHFFGMLGGSHSYFPDSQNSQLQLNGAPVTEFDTPYVTDIFTDEALQWIQAKDAASQKPWFLFASYNAPHTPMQATEEDLARYSGVENQKRRTYAAMMHALDRGVGRLLSYLDESGERANTLVVFLSDNGATPDNASWNGPLSGKKGTLREGGIRVPILISWPSRLPQGLTYEQPVSALDLLPTFMAAAQAKPLPLSPPPSYEDKRNRRIANKRYGTYDGIDWIALFTSGNPPEPRTLFWRLQGQSAILSGGDKLITLTHRPPQLFTPASDPGEQSDLSGQHRETMAKLYQQLSAWESSLATAPIWSSSPYWGGESARLYDQSPPVAEPK